MRGEDVSEVVGTAKAARWTGLSERRIREMCEQGRIEGAYQWEPGCKWLIPTATLEKVRPCPLELCADTADTA